MGPEFAGSSVPSFKTTFLLAFNENDPTISKPIRLVSGAEPAISPDEIQTSNVEIDLRSFGSTLDSSFPADMPILSFELGREPTRKGPGSIPLITGTDRSVSRNHGTLTIIGHNSGKELYSLLFEDHSKNGTEIYRPIMAAEQTEITYAKRYQLLRSGAQALNNGDIIGLGESKTGSCMRVIVGNDGELVIEKINSLYDPLNPKYKQAIEDVARLNASKLAYNS